MFCANLNDRLLITCANSSLPNVCLPLNSKPFQKLLAEEVGLEPTRLLHLTVFKTAPIRPKLGLFFRTGTLNGTRTRVTALKGRCPDQLDDESLTNHIGYIPWGINQYNFFPRLKSSGGNRSSTTVLKMENASSRGPWWQTYSSCEIDWGLHNSFTNDRFAL